MRPMSRSARPPAPGATTGAGTGTRPGPRPTQRAAARASACSGSRVWARRADRRRTGNRARRGWAAAARSIIQRASLARIFHVRVIARQRDPDPHHLILVAGSVSIRPDSPSKPRMDCGCASKKCRCPGASFHRRPGMAMGRRFFSLAEHRPRHTDPSPQTVSCFGSRGGGQM